MKKVGVLLFLLTLSLVSSAPVLKFQNEQINSGETILGTIEGNFSNAITINDLKFFEGRRETFIESEIYYFNQKYYFSVYPQRQGNFSLKIDNILYKENGELKSINLEKNFSVDSNNSQILSIKPGIIYFENKLVKLTNLGKTQINISISEDSKKSGSQISLNPTEEKQINFTRTKNFTLLEISTYKKFIIPIICDIEENKSESKDTYLKFVPEIILKNLIVNQEENQTIELFNFGADNIENMKFFSSSDYITLKPIENLSAKTARNVTINFLAENPGHFNENIRIDYSQSNKNFTIFIPLNLFILPQGSSSGDFDISEKSCSQLNGTVCPTEEICDGNSTFSKGAEYCCLGKCEKLDDNSSSTTGWIIGILIFLVIVAIIYFIYKKSKTAKPKNPEEKIKEISENYSKRINGGISKN
jgi:hypothetical protein